ncbi:MAG: hypothetical protein M1831_002848 [Alyxoria varia]|nr:MAG: hypothetical protein M1831_002848 [Alyxoria varia]
MESQHQQPRGFSEKAGKVDNDTSDQDANAVSHDGHSIESPPEGDASSDSHENQRRMKTPVWIVVSGAVLFSTLLMALDNTVVADLQPQIVEALGEINKFPWINPSFTLGSVGSALFWGRLYYFFNNKTIFIIAVALFRIGAAISGAAPNMDVLIAGRVVGGVGGEGLYMGAMNISSAFTTLRERPRWFSYYGVTWGFGAAIGPVVGGLFAGSKSGWRWAFYLNIIAGGLMMPIYLFLLPPCGVEHSSTILNRITQLDVVVFALQQIRCILTTKQNRLFPVKALLSSFDIWLLVCQTASNISILFIAPNYIPLYEQFVRSATALHAAVTLLPLVFITTFFIIFTGSLMGRVGYYIPWYMIGNSFFLVGTALMRTADIYTREAQIYGYTVLIGVGSGLYVQAAYPITQTKLVADEATDAVALIGTTQQGSTAIALTIANSIFINRAADGLQPIFPGLARSEVQAAIAGVGADLFNQLAESKQIEVLDVLLGALRDVWTQALASAGFAFALSLFMRRERIRLQ